MNFWIRQKNSNYAASAERVWHGAAVSMSTVYLILTKKKYGLKWADHSLKESLSALIVM
ncbi:MAG: hypothetical protein ACXVKM_11390 [Flavisolibacter sp.]